METVVGVEGNDEAKFEDCVVEKSGPEPTQSKQIADPVVYKLVRVDGDGRLVPATDDEVMEVEDLLEEFKIEMPFVADTGQTVECTSKEDFPSGNPHLECSQGMLQSVNTEIDAEKLSARLEYIGEMLQKVNQEERLRLAYGSPDHSSAYMNVDSQYSDEHDKLPAIDKKLQSKIPLQEIVPSSVPSSNDTHIDQSGSVGECSNPPGGPMDSGSSASAVCTSLKPDFTKLKGEICLDNLSIRELHETFKATFGRETSVKDKQWLKRRIAMGLTNSCDVSTTTFIFKDNKSMKKVKEECCKSVDGTLIEDTVVGAKNDNCRDSPTSRNNRGEAHQILSGKRLRNSSVEYDCGSDDLHTEQIAGKRIRKPTKRYIEELSEADSREYGGRLTSSVKNSVHGQSSPKSQARPVRNVCSEGKTVVTRLDSLGGSGVQVPYVFRVRRSRPRKNFMALMKFNTNSMGMAAKTKLTSYASPLSLSLSLSLRIQNYSHLRISLYMPRKGMRTIFFKASSPSSSHQSSPSRAPSSPLHESMMDENIDNAQSVISKWYSDESSFANFTSLFHSSRSEAKQFLSAVANLQRAMHFFVNHDSTSEKLIRSQNLMQLAMKRLEKEFYQILSSSREYLDPESVSSHVSARSSISDFEDDRASEEEFGASIESVSGVERESELAMADLKAIADCMISSGYGKECVKIYKLVRKSIVDESLYHLGVERLSYSQIQKMDWELIEKKIRHWLNAVKAAVKTLFYGERILCDHVFSASDSIRESCFSEITKEGALSLFGFPEHVARCKKTPEKMFRILDLYESISDLWPEIDSIFSFESTSAVLSQATSALIRLGEAVRTMLSDFEAAIQKDSSKTPIRGGGVHPLTRYVMNYVSFLSDYSGVLSVIVAEWPLTAQSSMPESYFENPKSDDDPTSAISLRLAWLVLVLLCKLDGRAKLYKDVSLSYIFLANNLQYVTTKVRTSNLRYLLGDDWIAKHEIKVKQYASNYERMGWSKVFSSLPENPSADISPEKAKEYFKKFNSSFEEVYRKQTSWVVPDNKLQEEIKLSIAKKLEPTYRAFYEKNRARLRREPGSESVVRFAPDDMENYLSDLFYGTGVSGSTSSSSSSPSSLSRG